MENKYIIKISVFRLIQISVKFALIKKIKEKANEPLLLDLKKRKEKT